MHFNRPNEHLGLSYVYDMYMYRSHMRGTTIQILHLSPQDLYDCV